MRITYYHEGNDGGNNWAMLPFFHSGNPLETPLGMFHWCVPLVRSIDLRCPSLTQGVRTIKRYRGININTIRS